MASRGSGSTRENHIWTQFRRDVPVEQDIGRPSFKVAICLQPGTAHKLALELLNIAVENKTKQALKANVAKATAGKAATGPAATGKVVKSKSTVAA